MATTTQLSESLIAERDALSRSGRLHWFHWCIVATSLLITVAAWHFTKTQVVEKSLAQFEKEASYAVELVQDRMKKYEDALWSGIAAIDSHGGHMERGEWQTFAQSLQIESRYPGISGIGVIDYVPSSRVDSYVAEQKLVRPEFSIHPKHSKSEYFPIVYIEPEAPNIKAVGLDMAHEKNRYEAAIKAKSTKTAQITGPIYLVQDQVRTPGFLFFAPYFSGYAQRSNAPEAERFTGLVYAPFNINKLMAGTLVKTVHRVNLKLSDGSTELYNENTPDGPDYDSDPMFTAREQVEFYGRTWTFDISSTLSFKAAYQTGQPTLILVCGIIIDALLLGLFLFLSHASRRSLDFADRMTDELKSKAEALMNSNDDLERLAYVTSHDLKTPLRGITDLASYIQEDLDEYSGAVNSYPEVAHNLKRIHQQTYRMENLINGIIDYSSVGSRLEGIESINVNEFVDILAREIGVRRDQLVIVDELPTFDTYKMRFTQVISNLVGNAFKYHPEPTHALVTVSFTEIDEFYQFSITDNGPGIDPKFHSRIFEVFQTLQSRDDIESTGIGLSIVKKSVQSTGGSIEVFSKLGAGTTFQFTWPKTISLKPSSYYAVN